MLACPRCALDAPSYDSLVCSNCGPGAGVRRAGRPRPQVRPACLPIAWQRDKHGRWKGRVAWLARENVAWRGVDVWMPAEDLEQVAGENYRRVPRHIDDADF